MANCFVLPIVAVLAGHLVDDIHRWELALVPPDKSKEHSLRTLLLRRVWYTVTLQPGLYFGFLSGCTRYFGTFHEFIVGRGVVHEGEAWAPLFRHD